MVYDSLRLFPHDYVHFGTCQNTAGITRIKYWKDDKMAVVSCTLCTLYISNFIGLNIICNEQLTKVTNTQILPLFRTFNMF